MKLTWKESDNPFVEYTAEGDEYSYTVSKQEVGLSTSYQVAMLRQPGGQVINRTHTVSLDGAFARAQSWENDKG